MAEPITIIVSPAVDVEGDPVREKRKPVFNAVVDGRLIARSTNPLRDACRKLLREGIDPSAEILMKYAGSEGYLRSTIRSAAELSPMGRVA